MAPSDDLSSSQAIGKQINEPEGLDLKTVDDKVIYGRILKLMATYGGRQIGINPSKRVYRVRRNLTERLHSTRGLEWYPPLFAEVRLVWYPLPQDVRTRGRINRSGESVFYCSTSINSAVLEMKPQRGEYLTILECAFVNEAVEPNIFEAGVHEGPGLANPNYGALPPEHDPDYQRYLSQQGITKQTQLIREFLIKQFVRSVESGCEHDYRITNAIAAALLNEFGFLRKSDLAPVDVEADGIAYASIAAEMKDANIAVTCAAADRLLKLLPAGSLWSMKMIVGLRPKFGERTERSQSRPTDILYGKSAFVLSNAGHAFNSTTWSLSQSVKNSRFNSPAAKLKITRSCSNANALISCPFKMRKVSIAACPRRLFPSRKGGSSPTKNIMRKPYQPVLDTDRLRRKSSRAELGRIPTNRNRGCLRNRQIFR